jgi:hypothetical protein
VVILAAQVFPDGMQLPPPPFSQKAQMRADHCDHAERAFDVDANGAARLQPGQGQAFNPTDVEVAMHEDRVAVPAQADIRRCDIGHAVGGFRLEDRLRQCRAARWHAPVGLLQNENVGALLSSRTFCTRSGSRR